MESARELANRCVGRGGLRARSSCVPERKQGAPRSASGGRASAQSSNAPMGPSRGLSMAYRSGEDLASICRTSEPLRWSICLRMTSSSPRSDTSRFSVSRRFWLSCRHSLSARSASLRSELQCTSTLAPIASKRCSHCPSCLTRSPACSRSFVTSAWRAMTLELTADSRRSTSGGTSRAVRARLLCAWARSSTRVCAASSDLAWALTCSPSLATCSSTPARRAPTALSSAPRRLSISAPACAATAVVCWARASSSTRTCLSSTTRA
mmetsp:Transcript_101370/g.316002  ORF Transcript_101370/g.316002 Transcript_101370/m.316002 type:complete len:266 (+) Transcript_101370:43-840(+)